MTERPEVRFYLDSEGIILRVIKNSPNGEPSLRLQWDFGTQPRLFREGVPIREDLSNTLEDRLRALASAFIFAFLREQAVLLAFLQKEEREEAVTNRFCTWNSGSPEIIRWGLRTGETTWVPLTSEEKEANLRLAGHLVEALLALAQ